MVIVSVIIPTYGIPKYLDKAIKSVLMQTLKEIELIVIDDNNPNTIERSLTEQLLDKYLNLDNKIKYIKHEKNKNGAVARNTGLALAKGKYIAFLDSDDEYFPERLEKCVKHIESQQSEKIAGVYTGCEFRKSGKTYLNYTNVKSGNFLVETLATNFMFCTGSNIFMKSDVFRELNGFDSSFLRHQDYEFLVRFFKKYDLVALQEVLVIKNNENVNLPNPDRMLEIKKQYLSKYKDIINGLSIKEQKKIYSTNYISVAEAYINAKNHKKAQIYYKKAALYQRIDLRTKLRAILLRIRVLLKK